jgi:hypothetical protein
MVDKNFWENVGRFIRDENLKLRVVEMVGIVEHWWSNGG